MAKTANDIAPTESLPRIRDRFVAEGGGTISGFVAAIVCYHESTSQETGMHVIL